MIFSRELLLFADELKRQKNNISCFHVMSNEYFKHFLFDFWCLYCPGTCAYLVSPFMVSLTEQGWLSLGVSVTLRLVKTKAVSSLKFKDLSTLCQGKITLLCVCECVFCPQAGPSLLHVVPNLRRAS